MSNATPTVKRYTFDRDVQSDCFCAMDESKDGNWICYLDYVQQELELTEVRQQLAEAYIRGASFGEMVSNLQKVIAEKDKQIEKTNILIKRLEMCFRGVAEFTELHGLIAEIKTGEKNEHR